MIKTYQNKPLIGISTNQFILDKGPFTGQKRLFLNQEYIESILNAGGIPFPLPINASPEVIRQQISLMDAILFSGGQDINPLLYKEEPLSCLEEVCFDRDAFEISMINLAHSLKKPILGICRGLQLINVAFGGTLYQDIGQQFPIKSLQHSQKAHKAAATHHVDIAPHSKLHSIFGTDSILTNSFHHQAVKDLAPGFMVSAKAKDGVVEGIEKMDSPFLLGVQWHPEMMIERHPFMKKLFEALVSAAQIDFEK